MLEEKTKQAIEYEERLRLTEEAYKQLKKEKDEQEYTEQRCVNCRKLVIPKFNEEGACAYHPGKMKFFSCRGCGGDQYFNCCQKCTTCTEGCRSGRHVF